MNKFLEVLVWLGIAAACYGNLPQWAIFNAVLALYFQRERTAMSPRLSKDETHE